MVKIDHKLVQDALEESAEWLEAKLEVAFRQGAKQMRERCARQLADSCVVGEEIVAAIRALPLLEEK